MSVCHVHMCVCSLRHIEEVDDPPPPPLPLLPSLLCFASSLFLHRAHRRVFVVCSDILSSKPLVTFVYSPYFLGVCVLVQEKKFVNEFCAVREATTDRETEKEKRSLPYY